MRKIKDFLHKYRMLILFFVFVAIFTSLIFLKINQKRVDNSTKKVIYTSFFPIKDLTSRIVGDRMEVKTIINGNQEPHDFELKAGDMEKISKADLVIYNGAGMENFIDDLKKSTKNDDKFLDLSKGLILLENKKSEETDDHDHHDKDEENEKHDHDEKDEKHNHEHHHGGVNPHTWLSVKNAIKESETIYKKVAKIDPKNEKYYAKNLEKIQGDLRALDKKIEEELAKVKNTEKYFVVSHAAFNYLARDYGLKQLAVTGISPEDEPTAKQLAIITDFVKEYKIKTIFFEGKATPKVAETLAKNAGVKTASLYTMESLTGEEMKIGYVGLMERNFMELVKSFNE